LSEQAFFVVGAIFLVALATAMVRLGRNHGGHAWAAAWSCLYASGLAASLSREVPMVGSLVPIFDTSFAALLFFGVSKFTDRSQRYVPKLVACTFAVALARVVIHPLIDPNTSQAIGSGVIVAGVIACVVTLLFPRGRDHTLWERALAIGFPAIAAATLFESTTGRSGLPDPPAVYVWTVTGILIGSLMTGALIALATNRLESLRREAERSDAARSDIEARYREVTEQTSDLIAELDTDGTILYANPAHLTLLGQKPEALIGRPASVLAFAPPSESVFARDSDDVDGQTHIFLARHADGRPVTLEAIFRRFVGADGEQRIVVTSRDITARVADERERETVRKDLEDLVRSRTEELNASIHELKEAQRLASLGTMAAGIAHQINNPIGSIQMSAEYALGAGEDDPGRDRAWRDALENSVEQARRCGRIVTSMLQFARNEPTRKGPEDLAAILQRACDLTERYASARNTVLDRSGVESPIPIVASAIELEQAFLNVLRNACESFDGEHCVAVSATRSARHATVRIRDDGRGMSRAEVEQVLDPFFTTRLDAGGTGLGLSVAHGVITDHGGLLAIQSSPGEGTTISVSLPLAEPPSNANG